jgi:CARDB
MFRGGSQRPELLIGLIVIRDAHERPTEEAVGIVGHVAELTATIRNVGDVDAEETVTRFWVRGIDGDDIDRELRAVHTPYLFAGDEVEVTALWDVRNRNGRYEITVTADVFRQIEQESREHNSALIHVLVRGSRVEPLW